MCEVGGEMEDRGGGREMRLSEEERKTGFCLDTGIGGWREVQCLCILGKMKHRAWALCTNLFSGTGPSIHPLQFCTKM